MAGIGLFIWMDEKDQEIVRRLMVYGRCSFQGAIKTAKAWGWIKL